MQMYVSVAKRKVLECIELPADTAALLTSNDKETNLHAVPLSSVTLKSMARLLKLYRGRYTTVVGFQPTGWTQKQGTPPLSPPLPFSTPSLVGFLPTGWTQKQGHPPVRLSPSPCYTTVVGFELTGWVQKQASVFPSLSIPLLLPLTHTRHLLL